MQFRAFFSVSGPGSALEEPAPLQRFFLHQVRFLKKFQIEVDQFIGTDYI